jgi:hypothetical protein
MASQEEAIIERTDVIIKKAEKEEDDDIIQESILNILNNYQSLLIKEKSSQKRQRIINTFNAEHCSLFTEKGSVKIRGRYKYNAPDALFAEIDWSDNQKSETKYAYLYHIFYTSFKRGKVLIGLRILLYKKSFKGPLEETKDYKKDTNWFSGKSLSEYLNDNQQVLEVPLDELIDGSFKFDNKNYDIDLYKTYEDSTDVIVSLRKLMSTGKILTFYNKEELLKSAKIQNPQEYNIHERVYNKKIFALNIEKTKKQSPTEEFMNQPVIMEVIDPDPNALGEEYLKSLGWTKKPDRDKVKSRHLQEKELIKAGLRFFRVKLLYFPTQKVDGMVFDFDQWATEDDEDDRERSLWEGKW